MSIEEDWQRILKKAAFELAYVGKDTGLTRERVSRNNEIKIGLQAGINEIWLRRPIFSSLIRTPDR